jgi:hypothetical protein
MLILFLIAVESTPLVAFAFKRQLFRVFVFLLSSDFSGCSEVRGVDSHIRLVPINPHSGYSEFEDSFVTAIGQI